MQLEGEGMVDGGLDSQGIADGEHSPTEGAGKSREDVLDEWGGVHGL